jgi:hypothetical protein
MPRIRACRNLMLYKANTRQILPHKLQDRNFDKQCRIIQTHLGTDTPYVMHAMIVYGIKNIANAPLLKVDTVR